MTVLVGYNPIEGLVACVIFSILVRLYSRLHPRLPELPRQVRAGDCSWQVANDVSMAATGERHEQVPGVVCGTGRERDLLLGALIDSGELMEGWEG